MLKPTGNLFIINKSPSVILILICTIFHLQIIGSLPTLFAANGLSCTANLDLAEENYNNGEFEKTISLVQLCIKDPALIRSDRLRAYKILSKTLLAKDNKKEAKEIIGKILDLNPTYLPTIEQEKPQFVNVVQEVIDERKIIKKKSVKSGSNNWLWIGAGGVAAAAIIVLLVSGSENDNKEDKDQSLPSPPKFP